MKKLLNKDKKNRLIVRHFERKKYILKNILNNTYLPNTVRWNAFLKFTNMPKNTSKTFLVNRCILTGRKKKFNKLYKFSRLVFLRLARVGSLTGIKKSCR